MPDLVVDGAEFSCNFCSSKLKLSVLSSPSEADGKLMANQTNCMIPPPGGTCTLFPNAPTPCFGTLKGSVIDAGQSTVHISGVPALGDGCKWMCPKGQMVSLSSAGQSVAQHDEAFVDGELISFAVDVVALLATRGRKVNPGVVLTGGKIVAKVGKVAVKAGKTVAKVTKKAAKKVKSFFKKPKKAEKIPDKAANQNRVETTNFKPKKSRSSHPEPDPRAEGRAHTVIEKPGKNGQYTTFNEDGTFKQYRGSGKPHGDIPRPNIKENKIDPRSPKGLPSKAKVRPANPDEIPKGD